MPSASSVAKNILVVGQGGREHALVRALRQSKSVENVHALPGSDGIALDAKCHNVDWKKFDEVLRVVRDQKIQLVVIGPEIPLEGGLSDFLRAQSVDVLAPSQEAARLESSKIFSKEFMIEAGVPTARHFVVRTVAETLKGAEAFAPPYVLKADGLAAGKGVFICKTLEDLRVAASDLFEKKILGVAGAQALLEEFSPGYEISYLVLTNGKESRPLILAQDHKRLLDHDEGPNTGGMGVVAPVEIDSALREVIDREVVERSVQHLAKRGLMFRGVLFIGLMITPEGPSVLEYNTRFGDPETQVILPLLDGDWGQVFSELAQGRMTDLKWKPLSAACVVLAAQGYPDSPVKGAAITLPGEASSTRYLLHAGTARSSSGARSGDWVTAGGRVLNAVGIGGSLRDAINAAYDIAREVKSDALVMRTDIGRRQLEG